LGFDGYLSPDSLFTYDTASGALSQIKALPAWFDASSMVVDQFEATSKDGTKVPYFVVRKADIKYDGSNPTLVYGYGGFQVSQTPGYSGTVGKLWLEQGGVYVMANIRGGGEFGPAWHQAGLKTKRQVVYDDFIAVAEDVIARKITSKEKLGAMGGSNGGLLMGVMFTQRPDLFKAIVCQVPLLDMLRYHLLLAGASWMDEYGDPDVPEERAFLEKLSPYHNVDPAKTYPEIYFETSTKDDRVHPAHARKLAKRLEETGKPFLYYENIDGGHSAAANQREAAKHAALEFTYLARKLMDGK
ncbi:MAG: S9 family peptidase, partial [Burkholderiales bacterium]